MARILENVFVNGISLVSKNETPAVQQAENTFALFKTVSKTHFQEIKKNLAKIKIYEIKKNLEIVLDTKDK